MKKEKMRLVIVELSKKLAGDIANQRNPGSL
jgi:hypothetical protein